jgi:hypothetical protein
MIKRYPLVIVVLSLMLHKIFCSTQSNRQPSKISDGKFKPGQTISVLISYSDFTRTVVIVGRTPGIFYSGKYLRDPDGKMALNPSGISRGESPF